MPAQLHALRAVPAFQREGLAQAVVQRHRAGNPICVVRKVRAQIQRQRVDFHLAAKIERQLCIRPRADSPAAERPFAVAAGDMFAVDDVARRKTALIAGLHVRRRVRIGRDIAALIGRVFRQIAVFVAHVRSDGNQVHVSRKRRRRIDRQPVIAICPPATQLDCICIHSDLVGCSRLPVRHLHTLGHRRIAFIGGSMQFHDYSKRGENFLEELRVLGLPDDPAYHVDCGYDTESGERAVLRMLSGLPRNHWPTGIIAFNDLVALGALKQLKKMGLRVPEDMAVIGCDNQFFCPYTDPPLTSVELYPEDMAQSAIRELIFSKDNARQSFAMMREASLIVRESCGAKLGYRKLG